MSSDDEIDYMSEEFLSKCVGNSDCRPGLLMTHSSKRKIEIEKKKKSDDENYRKKMKPIHEIQKEKMREALDTPIDSSNKGFAILQKMGYKPGMSLGKQGTGIIKPVDIVVKSDRIGIGWEELLKEKRRKYLEKRNKKEQMDPLEYRALKSNQHHQKQIEADLVKSRKACHNLDYREGITSPPEYWFWPVHTWEDCEEEEEEDYDNHVSEGQNEDIGDSSQHHENQETEENDSSQHHEDQEARENEQDLSIIFEPHEQLQILTSYLRSTYLYCVWCFTEYESNEDLVKNCPGPTRQDHDE